MFFFLRNNLEVAFNIFFLLFIADPRKFMRPKKT